MSFTHSCAHAHFIPIFPASQRYHGSSIVPNKSSSVEGGSLSWQDLLASPRGRLLWVLRAGAGSCLCPKALGSVPPHSRAASRFSGSFFRETKRCSWEGESKLLGTLKAFSWCIPCQFVWRGHLISGADGLGSVRFVSRLGDQGCTLHRAGNFQWEHPCLVIHSGS